MTPADDHDDYDEHPEDRHLLRWGLGVTFRLATPHVLGLLAGLAFSGCMVAAFDPFNLWPLIFVAPLPLVLLARASDRARAAVWAGVGSGGMWAWFSWWMWTVTAAGTPALIAHQMIFVALFVWLISGMHRRAPAVGMSIVVPIIWTGIEVLRGSVLWDGYPWYLLAHPLIDAEPLHRPAALGGAYLVSFLVAAWSGIVVDALRRPRSRALLVQQGIVAAIVAGVWAIAALLPMPAATGVVRLAAVQTNVPVSNKLRWEFAQRVTDFGDFIDLTASAAEEDVDAIVWPETMFPGERLDPSAVAVERGANLVWPNALATGEALPSTALVDALLEYQRRIGVPMIVGNTGFDGFAIDTAGGEIAYDWDAQFNSAFVIDEGRVLDQRYDKMVLTPFGEVMPGISRVPWLEQALLALGAGGMTFELSAGGAPTVLEVVGRDGGVKRIATPICFEVTAPKACRDLVFTDGQRRADVMVSLSNDGWFGVFDRGRAHHLRIARWRCVELATPMLRSVNTGISSAIDADGRMLGQLAPREPGVLAADLPMTSAVTVYGRIGDAFGFACFTLTAMLALVTLVLDLRREPDEPQEIDAE